MITAILNDMRKTPATMTRDEKMEVVARLEERGAFLVKRSAEQVAEALDLSRFTIFSYLKEIRRQGGGETRFRRFTARSPEPDRRRRRGRPMIAAGTPASAAPGDHGAGHPVRRRGRAAAPRRSP